MTRILFVCHGKISLLLDRTDHPRAVADPWYTRDFSTTWRDVLDGCTAMLAAFRAAGHDS